MCMEIKLLVIMTKSAAGNWKDQCHLYWQSAHCWLTLDFDSDSVERVLSIAYCGLLPSSSLVTGNQTIIWLKCCLEAQDWFLVRCLFSYYPLFHFIGTIFLLPLFSLWEHRLCKKMPLSPCSTSLCMSAGSGWADALCVGEGVRDALQEWECFTSREQNSRVGGKPSDLSGRPAYHCPSKTKQKNFWLVSFQIY